jgi:hypothetical protein
VSEQRKLQSPCASASGPDRIVVLHFPPLAELWTWIKTKHLLACQLESYEHPMMLNAQAQEYSKYDFVVNQYQRA